MTDRKSRLAHINEHFEALDQKSRKAYIFRLTKNVNFFETVCNAVDEGIMVLDRQLKIRYCNKMSRELLALPDDLSNIRISQFLPDIDWRSLIQPGEENWTRLMRQELQITYPELRFVQFYLMPLPNDPESAIAILRDVTENRNETINEMEKETVQAVSQLAAGVAHEIGNPLASLSFNLQLLEDSFQPDTPAEDKLSNEEVQDMVNVCKSEVDRLHSIITRFLSAIRPGKPKFAPTDLKSIIINTLKSMKAEIEARQIKIECNWPENMPMISGDAMQLQQAFYNVIRNAIQAMSNCGKLGIFGFSDQDFCVTQFADNGEGIKPEALSTMFNAFKTTKSGGNGIGTMIIERICREHGADFGLLTEPGRGTIFQIRFPLNSKNRIKLLPGAEAADAPIR